LPSASPPELSWRYAGFIKPAAIRPSKPPSVLSPFAQLRCYLRWGDVSAISSEGVTPPSSLLRAHVPLPLGSLLLRHLASFEESWQVVRSPCSPGSFPTLSLRIFPWMLDPLPRRYTVCSHLFLPRCHRPSPSEEWVGFPRFVPRITTSRRPVISRMQIFLDVPASKFALPPDRSYRCTYGCRAAGDFTSGPIVLCCLHTHRIC
jgi:hypothetical protein